MKRAVTLGMLLAMASSIFAIAGSHHSFQHFDTDDSRPFLLQFTDVVTKTAGLPVLRNDVLEPGEKEIRIWIGFGVAEPEKMVRIMVDKSGHISGETYLYYQPETQRIT
jgi:hypothetical protein